MPRTEGNWLIKDLLPVGGLAVLYGKPKTGKSFLALGIAEAVSQPKHTHFLGLPILKHGPVAYLQVDTPRSVWHERATICSAYGHDFSNVHFADTQSGMPFPFNILTDGPALTKALLDIKENAGGVAPVLIIIDTLREIFAGDENDSSVMKNVIAAVQASCGPNCAVLFLSHRKKEIFGQGDDLMSDNRGSSYVPGKMDCVMALSKKSLTFASRAASEERIICQQVAKGDEDEGWWYLEPEEDRLLTTMRDLYNTHPTASIRQLGKMLAEAFRWYEGDKEKERPMTEAAAIKQFGRKIDVIRPRLPLKST